MKTGEKAFHIFAPCTKTKEVDPEQEPQRIVFGFRGLPVFGLSQTDGEPLKETGNASEWLDNLPVIQKARRWEIEAQPVHQNLKSLFALGLGETEGDDGNKDFATELGAAVLASLVGMNVPMLQWEYFVRHNEATISETMKAINAVLNRTCKAIESVIGDEDNQHQSVKVVAARTSRKGSRSMVEVGIAS